MGAIQQQNYDTGKIFLGDRRTRTGTYTNSSGSTKTLPMGLIMGRVSATGDSKGKWKPWRDDATDGSEIPRGVLLTSYSVADGASQDITIVIAGDVVQGRLKYDQDGKDLNTQVIVEYDNDDSPPHATAINHGLLGDVLMTTTNIILVGSTDLTDYDNDVTA